MSTLVLPVLMALTASEGPNASIGGQNAPMLLAHRLLQSFFSHGRPRTPQPSTQLLQEPAWTAHTSSISRGRARIRNREGRRMHPLPHRVLSWSGAKYGLSGKHSIISYYTEASPHGCPIVGTWRS